MHDWVALAVFHNNTTETRVDFCYPVVPASLKLKCLLLCVQLLQC